MTNEPVTSFDPLGLPPPLMKALNDVGYETPSPIQAQTIPLLLQGKDLVGQAQTGTGKTAAFALPILARLDLKQVGPQVLVLTPTRELAIQVAEAFQKYATHLKGFHVLPVYGGSDHGTQVRALKRGVHVVVGTPGRVMDHMRRKTLKLNQLTTLTLDEADEMLRMGFIDDVEWILEHTPAERQIALFSATMPAPIRRIASKHLREPAEVTIQVTSKPAETIHQRFCPVNRANKLEALTRILEAEVFDAMLVFVRTRNDTTTLSAKLEARGYASAPLSGDIPQHRRERTVDRLKRGKLDILVATDVAARGLDVTRISHVINYDIPLDTEAYIHRIGRTGRAGRHGDAILFVTPRETRLLRAIERATEKQIDKMVLPTDDLINSQRISRFEQRITDTLASADLEQFTQLVKDYQKVYDVPPIRIAAALAYLVQGTTPLLVADTPPQRTPKGKKSKERASGDERPPKPKKDSFKKQDTGEKKDASFDKHEKIAPLDEGMERYRIEVGRDHKIKPAKIASAIADVAEIDSGYVGRIDMLSGHSYVDLPEGMPKDVFKSLKQTKVGGHHLDISHARPPLKSGSSKTSENPARPKAKRRHRKKDKGRPKKAHRKGSKKP